nr:hypothetical protein [Tanacetum cinerariifolium]
MSTAITYDSSRGTKSGEERFKELANNSEPPKAKTKYKKKADEPVTSSKSKTAPTSKGSRLKSSIKVAKTTKKKQPSTMPKTKRLAVLSEVPDVPKYALESDEESCAFSQDEDDANEEIDVNDDSEETESDNDRDDLTYPNLSTYKADDEEEEKADDDEVSSDHRVYTPPDHQLTDEEESQEGDDEVKEGKEEQEKEEELQVTEDTHVILTTVPPAIQQQSSSVSSDLVSNFINTSPDTAISSISGIVDNYLASKMKEVVDVVDSTMKKIIKEQVQAQVSKIMPKIKKYVTESLGAKVLVRSTNQPQTSYAVAASLLEFKLKKILINKIKENQLVNRPDIQKNLCNAFVESYNFNKVIFSLYDDVVTLKRVKWIEDKVSRIWSPVKVVYDKHAYCGTYHWGPKRQKFYEYASNMETSKDVYSRHRIIAVISLKIMKYFGYSHLEEIIVRRQDDRLYKFRKGDFKRLRRQDIEDTLLLLVQSKLSNLNLEERNHLMRTDELHKFSDGTLNHGHTALDDITIRIEMDYLPKQK